jgi:hypothetical protein
MNSEFDVKKLPGLLDFDYEHIQKKMQRLRDPAATERRLRNLIYFNLSMRLRIGKQQV